MLGRFCGYTKGAEIYAGRKEIQSAVWESVSSAELGEFTDRKIKKKQADRELERPAIEYKWKDLGDIYLSAVALENNEAR